MKTYLGILIAGLLLTACNGSISESPNQDKTDLQNLFGGNTQHVEYLQNAIMQPHDIVYSTRSGHAEFYSEAHGTVGIFMGESGRLNGEINLRKSTIEGSLDLGTLSTGITQRDSFIFNTLDVESHPTASFYGTFEPPFNHFHEGKQPVTVTGHFTMHGVTREVKLDGYLLSDDSRILLEAEWLLDVTEYNIAAPKIYSVKINDEIEIRIDASLKPQWLASAFF